MKAMIATGLAAVALGSVTGACSKSSSSSNPATVDRDDLNPPSGLQSLTGNKQLVLTWKAANAEKDFTGYDVFVYEGAMSTLTAPTFPSVLPKTTATSTTAATVDLTQAEVPRCLNNSALFVSFGFPASTTDCSGEVAPQPEDGSASSLMLTGHGATSHLADDSTATPLPPPTNMAPCKEATSTQTSLPESGPALDTVTCTITQAWNITTSALEAMQNGKTYTVFAAAVSGSNNENLSWTSNFVEDTPATPVYDSTTLSLDDTGKYVLFKLSKLTQAMTSGTPLADSDATGDGGSCSPTDSLGVCTINTPNSAPPATADGIYIGRLGSGGYPERAFVSVPAGGAFKILPRGSQTAKEGSRDGLPGDHAIGDQTQYDKSGTLYPIYGNQVFDFAVTAGSTVNYGKIVFGTVGLATATAETSDLNINMRIIMQPQASQVEYLSDGVADGTIP